MISHPKGRDSRKQAYLHLPRHLPRHAPGGTSWPRPTVWQDGHPAGRTPGRMGLGQLHALWGLHQLGMVVGEQQVVKARGWAGPEFRVQTGE